jgi:hypothetical protein
MVPGARLMDIAMMADGVADSIPFFIATASFAECSRSRMKSKSPVVRWQFVAWKGS